MARGPRLARRIYDEAVREALVVLWEASDRICGKRLKPLLPVLIEGMERHGHLQLAAEVRAALLRVSAATIDRALRRVREQAGGPPRRRAVPSAVRRSVAVRTFSDWHDPPPGSRKEVCQRRLTNASLNMPDLAMVSDRALIGLRDPCNARPSAESANLSDRELRDMGLSRGDIFAVANGTYRRD